MLYIQIFLNRIQDWFEKFFLNPIVGGSVGTAAVIAGAIASFYTDEIKDAHNFALFSNGQVSWHATIFWVAVVFSWVGLTGGPWAQGRAAKREREALQTERKLLSDAIGRIESLPPEGFLAEYQEMLITATRTTVAITTSRLATTEKYEQAIRNVLGAVLGLAKSYDKTRNAKAVYHANIMLYFPDGDAGENPVFSFGGGGITHPDHSGYLQLIPALSTTTNSVEFSEDTSVKAIGIHIPKRVEALAVDGGKMKYQFLPGATWAFVRQEFAGFPAIQDLENWLNERCAVDEYVKESVRSYFRHGDGKEIKSFVSIPLFKILATGQEQPEIYGVLNLHSEHEGILKEKGGERFTPLMEPFRQLLFILIEFRKASILTGGTS